MVGRQHQSDFKSETSANNAARCAAKYPTSSPNQLALLQRRLRIKSDAGCEITFHLRPAAREVFPAPGSATEYSYDTFSRDAQNEFAAVRCTPAAHLICGSTVRRGFAAELPLRRKAQRLALRTNRRKPGVVPDR
ncbi:hypothetical protein KCP76_10195 [Salmonella enterica subsp. enterica serovar Weltevreden]|nr:hypothetical protein KCP76_10195 [Salmonella enterica subsp. enterica serovar Weltevreden]